MLCADTCTHSVPIFRCTVLVRRSSTKLGLSGKLGTLVFLKGLKL